MSPIANIKPLGYPELKPMVPAGPRKTKPAAADTVPAQEERVSRKDVDESLEAVKDSLKLDENGVQLEVDYSTHLVVVKIVDQKTGEVIRQIPAEEIVRMAGSIKQYDRSMRLSSIGGE